VRTPDEALEALRALPCGARVAAAFGPGDGVSLVGGAVRDLLLGRRPRELDLVVEGDLGVALERLGPGEVTVHERFGTATLRMPDGCTYDLVRARAERYPRPGVLPEVRPGTLDEDLRRRDVTVNALALGPDGRLVGVPGACDDLRDGVLRVLHDASFADDPTRLWRVARYAARLGFDADPRTRALAAAADPATVSGDRLGAELRLALCEPDPFAALRAAAALHPGLLPPGYGVREEAGRAALALLPPDARGDLVVLASGAGGVDLSALLAWLDRMGFPAADRDLVAAGSRAAMGRPLHAARTPSEIARAARGAPLEAVALAGGDAARRWLEDLRHVRLAITGDDLLAAGVPRGPDVGARLRLALDAKLDGRAPDRDAELRAALGGPDGPDALDGPPAAAD
jgi:tRNA nucleotidyltransferase (CCA-adding enzyme)